jgi:hypothetical protein
MHPAPTPLDGTYFPQHDGIALSLTQKAKSRIVRVRYVAGNALLCAGNRQELGTGTRQIHFPDPSLRAGGQQLWISINGRNLIACFTPGG